MSYSEVRHNWTLTEVNALFALPFNELMFQAQLTHRANFNPQEVQVSTLLSIKTGACAEDCKYCPQSGHYNTGLERERLLEVEKVLSQAKAAKDKAIDRLAGCHRSFRFGGIGAHACWGSESSDSTGTRSLWLWGCDRH